MPVKANVLFFTLAAAALLIAFTGYSHHNKTEGQASLASTGKELRNQIVKTSKLKPPVAVSLELAEVADVKPNETYTLVATVKPEKDFGNVRWHWDGDVHFADSSNGEKLQLKAGEEARLSMRFRQQDAENRIVHLELHDAVTGQMIGRRRYNTVLQRKIAAENKELLQRQEMYLEENPEVLGGKSMPEHRH